MNKLVTISKEWEEKHGYKESSEKMDQSAR